MGAACGGAAFGASGSLGFGVAKASPGFSEDAAGSAWILGSRPASAALGAAYDGAAFGASASLGFGVAKDSLAFSEDAAFAAGPVSAGVVLGSACNGAAFGASAWDDLN